MKLINNKKLIRRKEKMSKQIATTCYMASKQNSGGGKNGFNVIMNSSEAKLYPNTLCWL